jgi:hypothetical protein
MQYTCVAVDRAPGFAVLCRPVSCCPSGPEKKLPSQLVGARGEGQTLLLKFDVRSNRKAREPEHCATSACSRVRAASVESEEHRALSWRETATVSSARTILAERERLPSCLGANTAATAAHCPGARRPSLGSNRKCATRSMRKWRGSRGHSLVMRKETSCGSAQHRLNQPGIPRADSRQDPAWYQR